MEKSDYLKLVEDNEMFKGLDDRTKAAILAAEGDSDMQYYLDMLKIAKGELAQLKKETLKEMFDISTDIPQKLKAESKNIMVKAEVREKKKDEEEEDKLMDALNNAN